MNGDRSNLRGSCWLIAGNASASNVPLDSQLAAPLPSRSTVQAISLSPASSASLSTRDAAGG
jgi:hypothetical protein